MKSRERAAFGRRARDPFTLISRDLLASPEWKKLQPAARVIFIDMAKRHRHSSRHVPGNNGKIGYGCAAGASAANVSIATAWRRLNELHNSGLARIRNPGAFKVKAGDGRASEWEIAIFPIAGRLSRFWGEDRLRLDHWLLDSPAYKNLTNQAKCILFEVMRRFDGGNNGCISFGGADGAHAGLSVDITERALTELERAGFLVGTAPAVPHLRRPRKWRLTMYKADGKPPTKEFMRIAAFAPTKARGGFTSAGEPPENISVMRALSEAGVPTAEATAAEIPCHPRLLANLHPISDTRADETFDTRVIRAGEIHLEASLPALSEADFAAAKPSVRARPSEIVLERSAGLFGDALPSVPTPLDQLRLELRRVLARKQGTRSRLAEALGLSRQTFANALSGRGRFTATTVAALRRWLDGELTSEGWPPLPPATEEPNAA